VYNGEIYNYIELRQELQGLGHAFRSTSDTEVLLHSYLEWGADCLPRLNGIFAFAIWDRRERRLFCARDRIGIKPFYYHLAPGFFLFGSDIKAILASGQLAPEIDPNGFYHGMSLQMAPRPLTAFKGIRALEQAHWMSVRSDGQIEKHRYWRIPSGPTDHRRSEQSYAEELESLLDRAVRRQLIADVPVGTFMSGGIDSTTVSALAARAHPGIKAFTLAYETATGMDETEQAKATAAMHRMTHVIKETSPDFDLALDEEHSRLLEEPFCMLDPTHVIAQLAKDNGVTVVLCGLGGDELFLGYSRESHVGGWAACRRLAPILSMLPPWGTPLGKAKLYASLPTVAHYYVRRFETFRRLEKDALFDPAFLSQVDEPDTARVLIEQHDFDGRAFEDHLQALCYLEIVNYLGNHLLHRLDAFTMHFSLEARPPLLDHELVEFAGRVPSGLKIRCRQGKYLLRQVARKHIHPSCLSMAKKGFGLPMAQWIQGPLREFIDSKLSALSRSPIFRRDAMAGIRQRLAAHSYESRKTWQLVSTQMWLEAFFENGESGSARHGLSVEHSEAHT
jgi:asparagine synthase (glutamine-hydrolysing)